MKKNTLFTQVTVFLLITTLLFPYIVKSIHHHHEHFFCDATIKNQKHYHSYDHNCNICNFEFIPIIYNKYNLIDKTIRLLSVFKITYNNFYFFKLNLLLLIRAPPIILN